MAAPESTKFQINYKLADGTLVNLYAVNQAELEASLTSISDLSSLITTTGTTLGATAQPSNGSGAVAYAKKALGATTMLTPAGDAPDCKHGTMSFRSGQGTKGPWKGWMCAAPKGATDKCDTVWIR